MTIPNPPGNVVVAPGQVIASDWGNAAWRQTFVRFEDAAQRDAQWPDPPEGSVCYIEETPGHMVFRTGAWRPAVQEVWADGLLAGPGGENGIRIVTGSRVITTDVNGASTLSFPADAATLHAVLITPGEDPNDATVTQFDSHPTYCQLRYRVGGNPFASGVVRIIYTAFIS